MHPLSDDALLSTQELSEAFSNMNLPMAAPTLDSKRSRGGGPPFRKYGKTIRYRWADARDWRLQCRHLTSTSKTDKAA
jgi:hypothetical protein